VFNYIIGIVKEVGNGYAIIENGGFGFYINTTNTSLSYLTMNTEAKLFLHEIIREDSFELYGFSTKREKMFFEMLLSVSGIGPKAAQSILNQNSPDALEFAIISGSEKTISAASGIGKKTAQRVILELKDKIGSIPSGTNSNQINNITMKEDSSNSALHDAVAGLNALGYSQDDIMAIIKSIDISNLKADEIIKLALKGLM